MQKFGKTTQLTVADLIFQAFPAINHLAITLSLLINTGIVDAGGGKVFRLWRSGRW